MTNEYQSVAMSSSTRMTGSETRQRAIALPTLLRHVIADMTLMESECVSDTGLLTQLTGK